MVHKCSSSIVGVILDSELSFDAQMTKVVRYCFVQQMYNQGQVTSFIGRFREGH